MWRLGPGLPGMRCAAVPVLVLAAVLAAAWYQYDAFLDVHRSLWYSTTHDRNGHYLLGLKLATDLQHGHLTRFLVDLDSARVWPPLHALMVAGVLLVGGVDYRLAVLPSLAGWVTCGIFAFLLVRRGVHDGCFAGGLIASLFVLASPSHRAFATDIMLESLGAGLTLVVIYAYAVAMARPASDRSPARILGLVLSALFLLKYSYWLLVVAAMLLATCRVWMPSVATAVRRFASGGEWRNWLRNERRQPLSWIAVSVLLLAIAVYVRGDRPILLGDASVHVYPPRNIIQGAYIALFARLVLWWHHGGRSRLAAMNPRVRSIVHWHAIPVLVWLLLPKRVATVFWYLTSSHGPGPASFEPLRGFGTYAHWFQADYHTGTAAALAVVALCAIAAARWRTLAPAGRLVLCLILVSGAAVSLHPRRAARMLHPWVAGVWVAAGMGASVLLQSRRLQRRRFVSQAVGAAVCAGAVWALAPAVFSPGRAPEGGPHPDLPSRLDLIDYAWPVLQHARQVTYLATVPVRLMAEWTWLERRGSVHGLDPQWWGFTDGAGSGREGAERWLSTTASDVLVFIDRAPGTSAWETVAEGTPHEGIRDLLSAQSRFVLTDERTFPEHACRVQIWTRSPQGAGGP